MLSREDKRIAHQTINRLRKNPPKITEAHKKEAKDLFEKHKNYEIEKDRDIKRELSDFSKDLSGFVYNHYRGVGALFHGFGEGKKKVCGLCKKHESTMHNMNDGKWYCSVHKWFGNLTEEQKRKELTCLST